MTATLDRLTAALTDRYSIERELGAGGMATVYLAHDIKHDRKVALKVLRPELAAVIGAERFLAEIKTTANLQHPHILALFDSGSAGGTGESRDPFLYYVMPFIEGESLRDRLTREKQLPVDEAIRIAGEIADALDYAHRHDVVHRDIKPENVLLHDGRALVADFGIALAVSEAGGTRMTETGLSLGTPHYMSPEQAMGERDLDGRSDIYALGCVLYEMLAGEPPFTGPSAQSIVAKVMTAEPEPVTTYRKTVPPHVAATLDAALQKLPADRFQTAREFGNGLAGTAPTPRAAAPAVSAGRRVSWSVVAGVTVAALMIGLVSGRLVWRTAPPVEQPTRFQIPTPDIGFTPFRNIELRPDGKGIVYITRPTTQLGTSLLYRPMETLEASPIPGAVGANPTVSPDGRDLLFTSYDQTFRVSMAGGQPVPLPDIPANLFQVWTDRGDIVYRGIDGGLWRSSGGGTPVRVSVPDSADGERVQNLMDALPGGRHVLVSANDGGGPVGRPYVLHLDTGERRYLLETEVRGVWYAGFGTLVYTTLDNMLYGIRFDPRTFDIAGEPVLLGGPVALLPSGGSRVSTSTTGALIYYPRTEGELVSVTRGGSVTRLLEESTGYHNPKYSPDGRRLAMDINQPSGRDVWVLSLDQGTLTRVTFDGNGHDAIWSPDGSSLFYIATRAGGTNAELFRAALDGSGGQPVGGVRVGAPAGWTSEGQLIAVTFGTLWDIVAIDSSWQVSPVLAQGFSEGWPAVSPDGQWLAYASDESRRLEVYLRPVSGAPLRVQISVDGGSEPVWSRDGRQVFYRGQGLESNLMMATLDFSESEPRVVDRASLFSSADYDSALPHSNYDVDPGGDGFVMVRRPQAAHLVLMQNVHRLVYGDGER